MVTEAMKPGDAVEVHEVWASQGQYKPPLKHWFGGYTFVSADGDTVIVRHTKGVFAGVDVRHRVQDVRLEKQS